MVPGAGEAQAETTGFDPVALFQRVYPKAAQMQAPLALIGGASSLFAYLASPGADEQFLLGLDAASGAPWLVSGALMGSLVPCPCPVASPLPRRCSLTRISMCADTLALMMPLNKQLLKPEALKKDKDWKRSRLTEWAQLHAVRTAVRHSRTRAPARLAS